MGSKTDVVVKLVLVFFISLLSFSIGTFVGKKYSDNQHQLAALEPATKAQREVASTGHGDEHAAAPAGQQLSDEEIAKLAEEFVADDAVAATDKAHGDAHGDTHAAATDIHAAPAADKGHAEAHSNTAAVATEAPATTTASSGHGSTAPSAAAKALVENNVNSLAHSATKPAQAANDSDRLPSSLPKNVAQYTVGKFTVQIASFATEAEAQKRASELKDKGYSAFYIPATVKGKTWYRVSVGQFATQNEAKNYRAEILKNAAVSTAIVQKITE